MVGNTKSAVPTEQEELDFNHGWLKSRDTEFGQETLSFCGVFLEERDGRLALAAGEVDCQMLNRCQSPSGVAGAEAAQVGA